MRGTASSDTLRSHFNNLIPLIGPEAVARALYTKRIIHRERMKEMSNPFRSDEQKVQSLLLDLIEKVKARPDWFEDICDIFEAESVPCVEDLRGKIDMYMC